jgi:putative transposase
MKRARFSEEQIITVLKEAESGAKVTELCRRHGISDATFYAWRSKYGGLEVSEMRRLRQLEEENRRLKSIVADQALDLALKDVLQKWIRPAVKRQMVVEVMTPTSCRSVAPVAHRSRDAVKARAAKIATGLRQRLRSWRRNDGAGAVRCSS